MSDKRFEAAKAARDVFWRIANAETKPDSYSLVCQLGHVVNQILSALTAPEDAGESEAAGENPLVELAALAKSVIRENGEADSDQERGRYVAPLGVTLARAVIAKYDASLSAALTEQA